MHYPPLPQKIPLVLISVRGKTQGYMSWIYLLLATKIFLVCLEQEMRLYWVICFNKKKVTDERTHA
jgi:hypothetical protein